MPRIKRLTAAWPLRLLRGSSGNVLTLDLPERIDVRLSGSANPYAWQRVIGRRGGGWIFHPSGQTGLAYERLNQTGLNGKVVELVRDRAGLWRFTFHRLGKRALDLRLCVHVRFACGYATFQTASIRFQGPPGSGIDETRQYEVSTYGTIDDCWSNPPAGDWTITVTPPEGVDVYGPPQTQVVAVSDTADTDVDFAFDAPPTVCVTVEGCHNILGYGLVPGATVEVTADGVEGTGTTGSSGDDEGRVCIALPGATIDTENGTPVNVQVTSPVPGLADGSASLTWKPTNVCAPLEVTVALPLAAGFACCCPFGTPDTLFYSDDFGSATLVWDEGLAAWVGEYTFTCPCGADDVECPNPYGLPPSHAASDPYAKAIKVRVAAFCDWNAGGDHGTLGFRVSRGWGQLTNQRCPPAGPIDCPGFPSTSWDDPASAVSQSRIQTGMWQDANSTRTACATTFSLSGSYTSVGRVLGGTTTPDQQACSVTGFTLTS